MTGTVALPRLRFPEFDGEWRVQSFESTFEPVPTREFQILSSNILTEGRFPVVDQGPEIVAGYSNRDDKLFRDVPITLFGDHTTNLKYIDFPFVVGADGTKILKTSIDSPKFAYFVLLKYNVSQDGYRRHFSILKQQRLPFPPDRAEQEKIAEFMSSIDVKLDLLKRRAEGLAAFKKSILQRIFSKELRFTRDDGGPFPEWEERRLGDVLTEHGERSSGEERVHSVSVHKGVVDQVEHLGRSFAAATTDHYNLVKSGDVIYTKSPTGDFPFGIIKQSRLAENVIVSPLYGVFTPETRALGYILNDHFCSVVNTHNYLHQLVQKGAKNTINITNARFLEGRVVLPVDHDEQEKIAAFLAALDAKIDAMTDQIEATRRFKTGLLQQMFV